MRSLHCGRQSDVPSSSTSSSESQSESQSTSAEDSSSDSQDSPATGDDIVNDIVDLFDSSDGDEPDHAHVDLDLVDLVQ